MAENGFKHFQLVEWLPDGTKKVLHDCYAINEYEAYRLLSRRCQWRWSTMDRARQLIEVDDEDKTNQG